ncbi:MAG: pyridoxine 5'-phosphate synthase [Candidatus Omnitrophota bacterium]|nr:pyridoxine 5'-phosphate synthase [Candidatus Omnitrophota bacterium]MDZ4241567.1 pyridoxine 5'-phosphate synthase [Candidatus Omnitrophota bacterium]
MPKLGVNIDHVATLRQARREFDPDPVAAARICEQAGADSIVCHLREDRRHINDDDVRRLRRAVTTRLNLEMSLNPGILDVACALRPDEATIVPERRQEVTTEGGLDVIRHRTKVGQAFRRLHAKGITVSLFIAPNEQQIRVTHALGIGMIELHTGHYALAKTRQNRSRELSKLKAMTGYARSLGITVNAGHGLNYINTRPVAMIPGMEELNIGHSIISYAVFAGLARAVREMKKLSSGRP